MKRFARCLALLTPIALAVCALLPVSAAESAAASDPVAPTDAFRPAVGAGTSFLDHDAKLSGLSDPGWYEANIPFVDLPDADIEATYYYR